MLRFPQSTADHEVSNNLKFQRLFRFSPAFPNFSPCHFFKISTTFIHFLISDCYMHELACIPTQYMLIRVRCIGIYCGMYCGMYWWYVLNTYQHVFNTNRYVFNTYLSVLVPRGAARPLPGRDLVCLFAFPPFFCRDRAAAMLHSALRLQAGQKPPHAQDPGERAA